PGPAPAPPTYAQVTVDTPPAHAPGSVAGLPPSSTNQFNTAPATGAGTFTTAENYVYEPQRSRPIHNALHRMGLGCWTTFNTFGCGSLHADALFVFGSCRQFFGEPCFSRAPEAPLPPGYQQGNGNGNGHGGAQRGCACE